MLILNGFATQSELIAQCSYERSVKVTQNINGSYVYGDLEIPTKFVHSYNYTILENGTKIDVDNYTRGCICDVKRCLRICTNSLVKFYNNYNKTADIDIGYIKNMTLSNGTMSEIHLVRDFHHIVGSVCNESYFLDPERDPTLKWTLFEVIQGGKRCGLVGIHLNISKMTHCEIRFKDIAEFIFKRVKC